MNFDSVVVKMPDGTQKRMTVEQFATVAITERVRLVSTGSVIFYKNGQVIPATEAFRRSA